MGEAAVKDDSMEGILASIRKIISSDVDAKNEKAAKDVIDSVDIGSRAAKAAEPQLAPAAQSTPDVAKTSMVNPSAPTSHAPPPKTGNAAVPSESSSTAKSFSEFADMLAAATQNEAKAENNTPAPKADQGSSLQSLAQSVKDAGHGQTDALPKAGVAGTRNANLSATDSGHSPMSAQTGAIKEKVPVKDAPEIPSVPSAAQPEKPAVPAAFKPVAKSGHDEAPTASKPIEKQATLAQSLPLPGPVRSDPSAADSNQELDTANSQNSPSKFKEALVSPATEEFVSSSMERLKNSVKDLKTAQVEAALRPLLREWLDANLAGMVEKMVREEIDRLSQSTGKELS